MDWWKKKKEKKKQALLCIERGAMLLEDLIKCCDGKSNPIKFFSADLILKATNNLSYSDRVSENEFYYLNWYSGIYDNYHKIFFKKSMLIKIFANNTGKYDSYFCRDVAISSMVSGHKNFMKLVGCCLELEDPVMVYYGEKNQYSKIDLEKIVSWKKRMKIAEDIATALAYLHTAFSTPFVYRNMSNHNILIDEDGVAKLIGLSGCISIPKGETFVTVDQVMGTRGYIDQDYIVNGIVSEKTDAYGFGWFMLTLVVGFKRLYEFTTEVIDFHHSDPGWISKIIEELGDEIADPTMLKNMGEVTEEERCKMNAFLLLLVRCLGHKGEVPTMVEVAKELKKIQRSSQNAYIQYSSSSSSDGIANMYIRGT